MKYDLQAVFLFILKILTLDQLRWLRLLSQILELATMKHQVSIRMVIKLEETEETTETEKEIEMFILQEGVLDPKEKEKEAGLAEILTLLLYLQTNIEVSTVLILVRETREFLFNNPRRRQIEREQKEKRDIKENGKIGSTDVIQSEKTRLTESLLLELGVKLQVKAKVKTKLLEIPMLLRIEITCPIQIRIRFIRAETPKISSLKLRDPTIITALLISLISVTNL